MADTSSPTYTKDPSSGAFYINSQSGLQLVTDSNTLQGLEQGTIPSTPQSGGTYDPAGGASYQPASATTDPSTGIDSSDPYTRFNMAIMDMLRTAQQGGQNTNLIAQQTALQQMGNNAIMAPQNPNLTNAQQQQLTQASGGMYQPEQDVVSNAIKAQDSRLTNFEGILSQLNTMGNNIATMNPGPDVIEGYVNALTHGASTTSIPEAVRPKVISSMTDDQWKQYEDAQKKGIIGSASSGYYQLQDDGTYQLLVPGTGGAGSGAYTGAVPLTKSQVQKLETGGGFSPTQIQDLQKYIQSGQDINNYDFGNDANWQKRAQAYKNLIGGTATTTTSKGDVVSDLATLKSQGTSSSWSASDWATQKSNFVSSHPNDSSAATQFDQTFSKPSSNIYSTIWNDITGVFSKLKVK